MVINFKNEINKKSKYPTVSAVSLGRLPSASLEKVQPPTRYGHSGIRAPRHSRVAMLNIVDNAITGDAVMARSKQLAQRRSVIEFGEFKAEFKNIINTFRGLPSRQRTFSVSVWKPIVHGGNMLLQRSVPRASTPSSFKPWTRSLTMMGFGI
jgi:hypothetical protein